MRNTYETEEDRRREAECRARIERIWQCSIEKNPKFYQIDLVAVKTGRIIFFFEVKGKGHYSTRYPTAFIGLAKWLKLVEVNRVTGIDTFLFFPFKDDQIIYANVALVKPTYRWGGRSRDQRDDQDLEPEVHIEIAEMKEL